MSKLTAIFVSALVLPVLGFATIASAAQPYGSIGGGNIVTSKNVTKSGSFADVTSATCGDTVKIRAYVHNPGPDALKDLKAKAELPVGQATSFSAKMTVSASNANPGSESDTTSILSDKASTMSYVADSAEYFDANGARLGSLSDSIVTSGADVPGGVEVSTLNARYVQLQAKLNCPTPPVEVVKIQVCELSTKNIITIDEKNFDSKKHSKDLNDCKEVVTPGKIQVCELATKKIVTIKETDFDSSKHTKDLNDCKEVPVTPVTPVTPSELPQTGAASGIAAAFGLSALAAGAAYVVQSRRNTLG